MADKNAALRNKQADDWAALWNGGTLDFLDASSNVLATITFEADAFLGSSSGAVNAIGGDGTTAVSSSNKLETVGLAAAGAGTAIASARLRSTGSTYEITGLTVGVGTGQVQVVNLSVAQNQPVSVSAFSYTSPATL